MIDVLDLKPLQDEVNIGESGLRIIVETSIIPMLYILTIKDSKIKDLYNEKSFEYIDCKILPSKNSRDYNEVPVIQEEGRGEVSEKDFDRILNILPNYRHIETDYVSSYGMIDGEFILIEEIRWFEDNYIERGKWESSFYTQWVELRETVKNLTEK